jgi:hypothetical protein
MPVTSIGGGPQRLAGPIQPGTAAAVLFTAQQPTILRDVKITNATAASAVVAIGINGSAAANIVGSASATASTSVTLALDIPLAVGDTVQAFAGTAAALTTVLTGEVAGAGV